MAAISLASARRTEIGCDEAMSEASSQERVAPDPLRLVQQFVNSIHIHPSRPPEEELFSAEALHDWLVAHDLMDPADEVTDADLARAVDVREGLRAILLSHNGQELDRPSVERLERATRHARVRVGFGGHTQPQLVADCNGLDGALARLLMIVASSAEQGTWERLKACPRDRCFWAFYDHSKNRSGRWCSMESCGNVEKARAFRERKRGA
jgi:predicted RNA-binding Zn ribbon-like protein